MQKYIFVKIIISQGELIPQGKRITLETIFPLMETTEPLKKLKIEEVSGKSHSAAKCKTGTLWDFSNIHYVAKYQKLKGGPFGDIKKICEKSLTKPK